MSSDNDHSIYANPSVLFIVLVTWPIQPIMFALWQNSSSSAFASDGKTDTA